MRDDDGGERRRSPRRTLWRSAAMLFDDGTDPVPCVVWDISETGARIRAAGTAGLPDAFRLQITFDGSVHDCQVAWRAARELGVAFRPAPPAVVMAALAFGHPGGITPDILPGIS